MSKPAHNNHVFSLTIISRMTVPQTEQFHGDRTAIGYSYTLQKQNCIGNNQVLVDYQITNVNTLSVMGFDCLKSAVLRQLNSRLLMGGVGRASRSVTKVRCDTSQTHREKNHTNPSSCHLIPSGATYEYSIAHGGPETHFATIMLSKK